MMKAHKSVESRLGGSQLQNACPEDKSGKLRRKKAKKNMTVVRRSQRIKRTLVHTSNEDSERVVYDLTDGDNLFGEPVMEVGKEKVIPEHEAESTEESSEESRDVGKQKVIPEAEAESSEERSDENVDSVSQRFEGLEKLIKSLQAKVDENIGLNGAPSSESFSYKTMYIDSQKQIEALRDENRQLHRKLEHAVGIVEVFEKASRTFVEALEKMKDVIFISNLAKTTAAAVNACGSAAKNRTYRQQGSDKRKRGVEGNGSH